MTKGRPWAAFLFLFWDNRPRLFSRAHLDNRRLLGFIGLYTGACLALAQIAPLVAASRIQPFDQFRRHTRVQAVGLAILGDDRTRRDDASVAHCNPRKEHGAGTDPAPVADADGPRDPFPGALFRSTYGVG